MSGHVAVVLAAGGSRRLGGRPKQLIERDGETLVQRALRLARQTAPARLLLVVGAHADQIAAAGRADDVQVVLNGHWRQGLGSSVRAASQALAVDAAGASRCLLLACDQPALQRAHLEALLHAADGAASGCAGSVHGTRLGVPAVVAIAQLLTARPQGDAGLRELLNALPPAQVGRVQAPELALDLDTPADLADAARRGWIDPPI
ncbi:nucleotidyltransferase family protein [Pseudoxanthomonas spadix]|uniref:nucleotidyltransferase family protein n=1 Tax=Pseudoxanthomonas spadix TaxID=415229 RepID=UPI001FD55DE9|nr:nucleotidyltransferase family protein [Pseudoxanthomonas spadix]